MHERANIIGIDLGGTKSRVARYGVSTWNCESEESIATQAERGLTFVLEDVASLIENMRNADTKGIGIGIAGLVKQSSGVLITAPHIEGSANVPVKKILEDRLKLPVCIQNDASCFTFAEAIRGAGKGRRVVVGITMGTGVGGGIVIDGEIFGGEHGFSAEIGHMLLKPGEPPFPTENKRGEVEQFLSGTAMGKRCEAAKRPEDYLEGEVCVWMRPEVFREVAWLATNLTHLLDPGIIVFGGSTGIALQPHLDAIEGELKQWMLPGAPLPALAIAELKDAGTLGAALLAYHTILFKY